MSLSEAVVTACCNVANGAVAVPAFVLFPKAVVNTSPTMLLSFT